MARLIKNRKSKTWKSPGSLIYLGNKKSEEIVITSITYNETFFEEKEITDINKLVNLKEDNKNLWINTSGIHKIEVIEKIGNFFGIHTLVLEDILNTDHRPKIEDYGNYLYLVLKIPFINNNELHLEHVSFILGKNYLISFQEMKSNIFNNVFERLKLSKGKIRKLSTDYLLYTLLDAIIDHYLTVLENVSETIEILEEEIINKAKQKNLQQVYEQKTKVLILRKSITPVKEIIHFLYTGESGLISDSTAFYLKDIYDHIIHAVELIDTLREILSEILNVYISSVSFKMNEVMKTLTVIATIFIPLTFIVGIYGMNFKYMPELEWKYGYFTTMVVMLIISVLMMFYFKKKKWF